MPFEVSIELCGWSRVVHSHAEETEAQEGNGVVDGPESGQVDISFYVPWCGLAPQIDGPRMRRALRSGHVAVQREPWPGWEVQVAGGEVLGDCKILITGVG